MAGPTDQGGVALAHRYDALWQAAAPPPDVFVFLSSHPEASSHDRLDVLLVDQRRRARDGRPLPAEAYLDACPDIASDPALKHDLIYGEWQAARERGQSQDLDSFATRFPDLRDALANQLRVDERIEQIRRTIASTRMPSRPPGEAIGVPTTTAGDPGDPGPPPLDGPEAIESTGRFSIRRQLGAGGMGVVYLAYDRDRGHTVALKTMRWASPNTVQRA